MRPAVSKWNHRKQRKLCLYINNISKKKDFITQSLMFTPQALIMGSAGGEAARVQDEACEGRLCAGLWVVTCTCYVGTRVCV